MLRHIVSISLAMTACATLISTKANAATFTATPTGEIQKNVGDSIEFVFVLTPDPSNSLEITAYTITLPIPSQFLLIGQASPPLFTITSVPKTISRTYLLLQPPTKSLIIPPSDVYSTIFYNEYDNEGNVIASNAQKTAFGADVVPTPEPLTILSAATALGYGIFFKRQSLKNKKS